MNWSKDATRIEAIEADAIAEGFLTSVRFH